MNYLHYELNLGNKDVVIVQLDKQANVRLLDDTNYLKYSNGSEYQFYGGRAVKSPVHLNAPHSGFWHLVIDLGGYAGTINASVNIRRG